MPSNHQAGPRRPLSFRPCSQGHEQPLSPQPGRPAACLDGVDAMPPG